jgi:hypothetical protein
MMGEGHMRADGSANTELATGSTGLDRPLLDGAE